jgi:hypothetical protein
MSEPAADRQQVPSTWIAEAVLDLPCQLPSDSSRTTDSLYVSLGGAGIDGFVQLRPQDVARSTSSVFWASSAPLLFDCRAAVVAMDGAIALLRAQALYEHVADRLTLFTGYPARILSSGFTYNEDQLIQCIAGNRAEYEATTGGEDAFQTGPIKNPQLAQVLHPPEVALEAIRWFRHAMSQPRPIDQFLSYYIALESISRHVPGVERAPRRAADGSELEGEESLESAGVRHLAARHPTLPPNTRQELARIRARIAHGSTNPEVLHLAFANLSLVQRLAADGIALVVGVPPEDLQILQPKFASFIAPLMHGQYEEGNHPIKRWGKPLTQTFREYLTAAGQQSQNNSAKDN